jgi:metallo-beta-lactamase class B
LIVFAAWLALAPALFSQQGSAPSALTADPPMTCDACAEWNTPRQPFKVFGNTYYVGTMGLSSVIIAGDQGLILLDVALPQSAPLIDANVRALGFQTKDIKFILTSHAHYDHVGGVRSMQRFTGATVAGSARTVEALRLGHPTADDPQFGTDPSVRFPAITSSVRAVKDGETLRLGHLAVTAHYTPGHTPGATSWTWQSCEGSKCLAIAYVDSLTSVSNDGFKYTAQPGLVDSFRKSLRTAGALPCDVLLTTHPSASGMDEKVKRRAATTGADPFVNAGACKALADTSLATLEKRVKDETAK